MKNTLLLAALISLSALTACQTHMPNTAASPAKPAPQAAAKQDVKACSVDADCVAVPKGCCQCDGYEAVNKNFAAEVTAKNKQNCPAFCTMQFCFNEITPKCVANKCTEEAKIYPEKFSQIQ